VFDGDALRETDAGADVPVTVTVLKTGNRRGKEVVQLYANRPDTGIERPLRGLVGFRLSVSTKISIFRGSTSAESQRCPSPDLSSARRTPGLRDQV
jgi:hypothetical protein